MHIVIRNYIREEATKLRYMLDKIVDTQRSHTRMLEALQPKQPSEDFSGEVYTITETLEILRHGYERCEPLEQDGTWCLMFMDTGDDCFRTFKKLTKDEFYELQNGGHIPPQAEFVFDPCDVIGFMRVLRTRRICEVYYSKTGEEWRIGVSGTEDAEWRTAKVLTEEQFEILQTAGEIPKDRSFNGEA